MFLTPDSRKQDETSEKYRNKSDASKIAQNSTSTKQNATVEKEAVSIITPSYTTTKDSKVYRNVVPKFNLSKATDNRIVNSALSNKRDPESPRLWRNSSRSQSPFSTSSGPSTPTSESIVSPGLESPRIMRLVRTDSNNSSKDGTNDNIEEKRLYDGGKIPSRAFRQLQTSYAENSNQKSNFVQKNPSLTNQCLKSNVNTVGEKLKSVPTVTLTNQNNTSRNTNAGSMKPSVIKELSTQFDSVDNHKKPKAAPGRVFKQLQDRYDNDDSSSNPSDKTDENSPIPCYQGSRLPSASFRFLQSKYNEDDSDTSNDNISNQTNNKTTESYEEEQNPSIRCPGKTFKSLQDNVAAHPSIFEARRQKQLNSKFK